MIHFIQSPFLTSEKRVVTSVNIPAETRLTTASNIPRSAPCFLWQLWLRLWV